MIAEALKSIRAMKRQYQVYEHAEKVLEELSAAAETDAQVRKSAAEHQEKMIEREKAADKYVEDAKQSVEQLHSAWASWKAKDEGEYQKKVVEYTQVIEVYQERASYLNGEVVKLGDTLENAKRAHMKYMADSSAERVEMERALEGLRKRFN